MNKEGTLTVKSAKALLEHLKDSRVAKAAALATTLAAGAAVAMSAAHAGTDTTFDTVATQLTGYLEGSLGTMLAVGSLIAGVVSAVIRFQWQMLAASVGVATAASFGPGVINTLVSATI